MPKPEDCNQFETCSSPLCPLDPDLHLRVWHPEEPICTSQKHGSHRWIRKQRMIVRKQPRRWMNNYHTYRELFDASRPMKLTEEQREFRRQQLAKVSVHNSQS